ncbi:MAG: hypothetical protein WCJ37_14870 [Syntrophus sp. (in: bacteria)]
MVKFEHKKIKIEVKAEITQHDYRDEAGNYKSQFNRNVSVKAKFLDFSIDNNLYELAMVKSTLNYFMQAYWKRSTKLGSKIDLATSLEHYKDNGSLQSLNMSAKQKNNIYSLEISLTEDGQQLAPIYLSAQEVIMLDIAISKAIALLAPEVVYSKK